MQTFVNQDGIAAASDVTYFEMATWERWKKQKKSVPQKTHFSEKFAFIYPPSNLLYSECVQIVVPCTLVLKR
jgi:hypothetical protein